MKTKSRKPSGIILLLLFCAVCYVFIPPFYLSGENIDIPIYSKTSAREIARMLKEKGILRFSLPFRVLTKLTRADRKLKAGLYRFSPRMSLWSLVSSLTEGRIELMTLKVPEGFTVEQIAEELEELKVTPQADFLANARNAQTLKALGIPGPSMEGFLFPETYRVPLGASAAALQELMVHQFFLSVGSGFEAKCRKQGLTMYQGVVLASIVEKEARLAEERPVIAGILYNRLHQKMRLQVNATLNYVLANKRAWLTNEQINTTKGPYNTYLRNGLPPTPICNPGLPSLLSVLEPAQVPYLYYVAQGDGSHLMATTFAEHEKNIHLAKKILRGKRARAAANEK